MRTNLAERLGYEPEESTEERQARLGCCWLSGVAFALCIIAGCAHAAEIAAVLGGVSLTTFLTGIWL